MSQPFVYTPEAAYEPGPYGPIPTAHSHYSPFAPDVSLLPPSPYSHPGSLQASPNVGVTSLPTVGVAFPTLEENFYRQRRPSWHGPPPVLSAGLFPPQGHVRSNSFGQANAPAFFPPPASAPIYNVNWSGSGYSPWGQPSTPTYNKNDKYIHPWLNGENPRKDFLFNMALPTFSPMRLMGNGASAILGTEELAQFATYPAIHELTIICDRIPQWPIVLKYQPLAYPANPYAYPAHPSNAVGAGGAPPIAVGDILQSIHTELHKMITQSDYRELSTKEQESVKRAYARRCASGGQAAQQFLLSQGVKRVDFLGTKSWFRGLLRTGEALNELKLVTGSA